MTQHDLSVDGELKFRIDVKADAEAMSTWTAERIAAFFGGIAKALAAERGMNGASGGGTDARSGK